MSKKEKIGIRKVASKSLTGGWVVIRYTDKGATPIAEIEYLRLVDTAAAHGVTRAALAAKLDATGLKIGQIARTIAAAWAVATAEGAAVTAVVAKHGEECAKAVAALADAKGDAKAARKEIAALSRKIENEYAYRYTLDNR